MVGPNLAPWRDPSGGQRQVALADPSRGRLSSHNVSSSRTGSRSVWLGIRVARENRDW